MKQKAPRGVLTALITPFHEGGAFDESTFLSLIDRQLEAGVHGLVPCGTTGETPTMSGEEWERVITLTVQRAAGAIPVVPGTGSNSTRATIEKTRRAAELGADAVLVVTPYYNKPNPDGMVAHYRAVAEEGGLPIVVYNVPARTGINLTPDLLGRVWEIPGVCSVKEAAGDLSQAMTILARRPQGFTVLSGEDELICPMALLGGDGVISVLSNVDPEGTVKMVEAAWNGDVEASRAEHFRLLPLVRALFAESNPVPVKAALQRLGLCTDVVRPPLAAASEATRRSLDEALAGASLR